VTDRDALADSVTAARFPTVRLRQAYSAGDVDAFLTDLAAAVRAGAPVRERIDAARFKQGFGGYDMGAVDDFLDRTGQAAGAGTGGSEPAVVADPSSAMTSSPSAISRGDGTTRSALRALHVVVSIVTFGVIAGMVALVVRNLRADMAPPLWPTVLVGCGVGLVYDVVGRMVRARRR
jgi:DivIVA domain-containing protein